MEFRDLEYFAMVAEHRNLGRAAEALGLSHPALSKSLRRLESSVNAKLVKRTPKGVELTAEGAALLTRVSGLRLSLRDVEREIADIGDGRGGHLRIGIAPGVDDVLIASSCAALLRQAPRVTLKLVSGTNDVLVPQLEKGLHDLVVSGIPARAPASLAQEVLYEDQFVIVAAAAHPLGGRESVALDEATNARWVLSSENTLSWIWLHQAFHDNGFDPPDVAIQCSSNAARLQIVAASDLLGFGSRHMVERAAPRLKLTAIRVNALDWSRRVGVSYRKGAYLSPTARRLIDLLKESAQNLCHA